MPNQSISEQYQNASDPFNSPAEYLAIECHCFDACREDAADFAFDPHTCGKELWAFNGEKMVLKQAHKAAATPAPTPKREPTPTERLRVSLNGGKSGDLSEYLTPLTEVGATPPPPPAYMRSDGATILPEGCLSSFYGMPSMCKSWLALDAARAVTRNGGRVLFWDFEGNKEQLKRRADAIGYDVDDGLANLNHAAPALADDPMAMAHAALWVKQGDATGLVVIDACNSAGCPSDGADVSPWFATHVRPWGKDVTILLIDHIPKRADDRAPGAIGSVHKTSMLTGVALLVEGKGWTPVENGRVTLEHQKDREGVLPAGKFRKVAAISGTHDDGVLVLTVDPPNDADNGADLRARIVNAVTIAEPDGIRGKAALRKAVGGKGKDIDAATDLLVSDGVLQMTLQGRAQLYQLAREDSPF